MTVRKEKILLALLLTLFISIRLFDVHLPYYRDEIKNAVHGALLEGINASSGHPPLAGWIITAGGFFFGQNLFFGQDYLRLLPLLFGTGSFLLLYVLMRLCLSARAALWGGLLYAISPYGVFASLMVDLDGAILPFFAVAAFLAYELLRRKPEHRRLWWAMLGIALALGALTKLSFVLVVAALCMDSILRLYALGKRRTALYVVGILVSSPVLVFGIATLSVVVFPSLDIRVVFGHIMDYVRLSGRNYMQIVYESLKAILYLSPLLIVPVFFISKKTFSTLRPLALYLGAALIFYLIVFDFSLSALDKYLMVAIVPLCALSGAALSETEIHWNRSSRYWLIAGLLFASFLVIVQSLPHVVYPLHPKGDWMRRILALQWNFLVPFTGGAGPLGFYSSWLFLGMSWLVAFCVGVTGLIRRNVSSIKPFILITGIAYCVIMLFDMLLGYPHGDSSKVLNDAIRYIQETPSVHSVITYNDAGGYKISQMGKYFRRMLVAPKYEKSYQDVFSKFKGHLLVVDIPPIYHDSLYWRYILLCRPEFVSRSGYISATLYNCSDAAKP